MYVVVATEGSFLKEHKNLKLFYCTQQSRVTEVFYQLSPPPEPSSTYHMDTLVSGPAAEVSTSGPEGQITPPDVGPRWGTV